MNNLPAPVALVGHSGFVGQNLAAQHRFDLFYRRSNIGQLESDRPATIVCAGAPAAKWQANSNPEADLANLTVLMDALRVDSVERLILISTVDVYPEPSGVDETSTIAADTNHAYGRHRYYLEEHAREVCDQTTVVRLPALFGTGLKKNLVFDLLNERDEQFTHRDSTFQFYDLASLSADIATALEAGLHTVNIATEPMTAREVAARVFGVDYTYRTESEPVHYDMRTRHASVYGRQGSYIRSADETVAAMREFVAAER